MFEKLLDYTVKEFGLKGLELGRWERAVGTSLLLLYTVMAFSFVMALLQAFGVIGPTYLPWCVY